MTTAPRGALPRDRRARRRLHRHQPRGAARRLLPAPQANPPTTWPAERFADLFAREVTEGMVVPRVERRGAAGLVTTVVIRAGMTATDESLLRGAVRAALSSGVAASFRFGEDELAELEVLLDEGLGADRVVVGGLDRADAAGS